MRRLIVSMLETLDSFIEGANRKLDCYTGMKK
jgi:hypothetical protein